MREGHVSKRRLNSEKSPPRQCTAPRARRMLRGPSFVAASPLRPTNRTRVEVYHRLDLSTFGFKVSKLDHVSESVYRRRRSTQLRKMGQAISGITAAARLPGILRSSKLNAVECLGGFHFYVVNDNVMGGRSESTIKPMPKRFFFSLEWLHVVPTKILNRLRFPLKSCFNANSSRRGRKIVQSFVERRE